jgi:hypothetical protein
MRVDEGLEKDVARSMSIARGGEVAKSAVECPRPADVVQPAAGVTSTGGVRFVNRDNIPPGPKSDVTVHKSPKGVMSLVAHVASYRAMYDTRAFRPVSSKHARSGKTRKQNVRGKAYHIGANDMVRFTHQVVQTTTRLLE